MSEDLANNSEIKNQEPDLPEAALEHTEPEGELEKAAQEHTKPEGELEEAALEHSAPEGVLEQAAASDHENEGSSAEAAKPSGDASDIIAKSDIEDDATEKAELLDVPTFQNTDDVNETYPDFQHQNTPAVYPISYSPEIPSTQHTSSFVPMHDLEINEFTSEIPGQIVETNHPLKPDSGISSNEGNLSYEDNYIIVNRLTDDQRHTDSQQFSHANFVDDERLSGPLSRSDIISSGTAKSSANVKMRLSQLTNQPISISSSNGILHTSLRAAPLAVKITEVDEQSGIVYGTLADEPMFHRQYSNSDTIVLTDRQIARPAFYNGQVRQQSNGQTHRPYSRQLYQQSGSHISPSSVSVNRNEVGVTRAIIPELPYIEDFNNIGPGPTYVRCPKCNMKTLTRVDRKPSSCAFISGFFLCLCLSCFVPFCMKRCQAVDHYCIRCQTFLGRYSRC